MCDGSIETASQKRLGTIVGGVGLIAICKAAKQRVDVSFRMVTGDAGGYTIEVNRQNLAEASYGGKRTIS